MINDQTGHNIRALFDWRNSMLDDEHGERAPCPVANDDLALALQLLSCNPRDRQQFSGARTGAAPAA